MTMLSVPGCRSTPLGSYLTALGLLRVVTRLLDNAATGHWERQRFVLGSRLRSLEQLVDELLARFEPEAIVSLWKEGAGFVEKSANRSAAKVINEIRDSTDPKLARLREAIAAGDRIVQRALDAGLGGQNNDLWKKDKKRDVLALCRNELPDHALAWLDAVVALGNGDPTYSRLLGTGGNFGRQELSANYLNRLHMVRTHRRSRSWLSALLTGDESIPYLRDALGQFDPGRAGGIQSSPLEEADKKGFVNPWGFLLTLEGTFLFAGAVVRRHGAGYTRAALPFQVHGSAVGYPTQAQGEKVLGELWAPEWSAPAQLTEVEHLFAEGRAEWNGSPASSGLDFARAVCTLGVDRGIDDFQRHVFIKRHGRNPLAIPANRIKVRYRPSVKLLAQLDIWLDQLHRAQLPAQVQARLRSVEKALFYHASSGEPGQLVEVITAIGRCHEAVALSGMARKSVRPLLLPGSRALLDELRAVAANDTELQIALALATARDLDGTLSLRGLISPVTIKPTTADPFAKLATPGFSVQWRDRPTSAPLSGGLAAALGEAARRRGFPGAGAELDQEFEPVVKGARIGFQRGILLTASSVYAFVFGELDDHRVADLVAGLLTVNWSDTPDVVLGNHRTRQSDPSLDLLLPFTGTEPIRLARPLLLRPAPEWPALLRANRSAEVLADAARRLRIGGIRHVIDPVAAQQDGARLATILLFRVRDSDRLDALRRVAALPPTSNEQNQEIPNERSHEL
jgi:CRISPR-associated protein Csx17